MAGVSTFVKNNTMGTITITDGTGTPVSLTVAYDKGDVAIDGLGHRLNELKKIQGRGRMISSAYGARRFPSFKFSAFVPNLAGATASGGGTLLEMLTQKGAYSANISASGSSSNTNRPYTVNVKLAIEGSSFGDTADESIQANEVHCTIGFQESEDGNTITIEGEVLGTIVVTNDVNVITYSQVSSPTP